MKKLNDKDREIFNINLENLDYENYSAIRGKSKSGRLKHPKAKFRKRKLKGQGSEKTIIPSNIIEFYTRLEILLGLKLSGHLNTLTETSNLKDGIYYRGEIQNEQQYPNALSKIHT